MTIRPSRASAGGLASWCAMNEAIVPDDAWDAGDLGCGELVIVLWNRLRALPPGAHFLLTATDPGAMHDLPAWCRLTGHGLITAEPPRFLIRRKD